MVWPLEPICFDRSIKECIRRNKDVSITLYRDHRFGGESEEREEKKGIGRAARESNQ
jgi:hypothetical protein